MAKKAKKRVRRSIAVQDKPRCGLVMPISLIDGCDEGHWEDVRSILSDAVADAGFDPDLVSNADEVGIIQGRIIQNLYNNPIVVCDVSGKNPNVMFELGMRLAFDKPTVIVKDEKTSYTFDTSPIEHLTYPRDLRFATINEFKRNLAEKVKATYEKSTTTKNYSTFLKHFGQFRVASLDEKQLASSTDVAKELSGIREAIFELQRESRRIKLPEITSVPMRNPKNQELMNDAIARAVRRMLGTKKVSERVMRNPKFKDTIQNDVLRQLPPKRYFESAREFELVFDLAWSRYYTLHTSSASHWGPMRWPSA